MRLGKRTWLATVTEIDPDHDLCQLEADGLGVPAVPLRVSSAFSVEERAYGIGAPQGLELTISEALISGLSEYENGRVI